MQCPQCGSENVSASKRRGFEKVLRFLYPKAPYRCRECWGRFWSSSKPGKLVPGKSVKTQSSSSRFKKIYALIFLLIIAAALYFKGSESEIQEPVIPPKPITKALVKKTIPPTTTVPVNVPEPEKKADDTSKQESGSDTAVKTEVKPTDTKPVTEISNTESKVADTSADKKEAENVQKDTTVSDMKPNQRSVSEEDAEKKDTQGKTVETATSEDSSAHRIRDIQTISSANEFKVVIITDSPIEKYRHYFADAPPPRVVLDILGDWKYFGNQMQKLEGNIVEKIRIGHHLNQVRIVMDLIMSDPLAVPLTRTVEKTDEGIILTLNKVTPKP